jgi:hypothetical protein
MYTRWPLLLHVSAAHGPSSGNTYYLRNHCTVHFVFCTYERIVGILVNLFGRIFLPFFFQQPFQCSSLLSFTCVYFSAVCSCDLVFRVPGYRSRDPGFDSWRYQIFWEIVGLERGPFSLVRITEELLERKNSGSGCRKSRLTTLGDPLHWPRDTLYPQTLALYSPTCGGRSVGIVCLRTKATEFCSLVRGSNSYLPLPHKLPPLYGCNSERFLFAWHPNESLHGMVAPSCATQISVQRHEPLSLCLYSPMDLGRFFSFLILHTDGMTAWRGDQPVVRSLPTHRTIQTQNKRIQTSMPQVGFEHTTTVFERAKTVHALNRAATAICVNIQCIKVSAWGRFWVWHDG